MDSSKPSISISPIGLIRTPFKSKNDAPIQGVFAASAQGTVEINDNLIPGLKDVEGFSHLILIYHFDRSPENFDLIKPMLLDDIPHGILASRNPVRPNRVGITVVQVVRVDENKIYVSGVDMLDRTPLIDIKPYVPRFDSFPNATEGWFSGKQNRTKPQDRE